MSIAKGYQLHITSWENDADHYKTEIFEGLTENDTRFLIAVSKLFRSMHGPDRGFGGGSWHYKGGETKWYDDIAEAIQKTIDAHPDISDEWREMFTYDRNEEWWHDHMVESITMLVSYPGEGYPDSYIRVFDSYKVFYFPAEVEEVTDRF